MVGVGQREGKKIHVLAGVAGNIFGIGAFCCWRPEGHICLPSELFDAICFTVTVPRPI